MMKRIISLGVLAVLLTIVANAQINEKYKFVYKLHGQTRNYEVCITEQQDTIRFEWSILRNFKWQKGCYKMGKQNVENGNSLSWLQPVDGCEVALPANETFGFISRKAWKSLKEIKVTVSVLNLFLADNAGESKKQENQTAINNLSFDVIILSFYVRLNLFMA